MLSNLSVDQERLRYEIETQIQHAAQHLLFEQINDRTIYELNRIAQEVAGPYFPGYDIKVEQEGLPAGDVNFILTKHSEEPQRITFHAIVTEDGFLEPE